MAKALRHPLIPVYLAAVIVPQQGSIESGFADLHHAQSGDAGPAGDGGLRMLKLVMAYVPSSINLMDALRAARGGLPEGAVRAVLLQLVSVLEHLHQNGVVYVVRPSGSLGRLDVSSSIRVGRYGASLWGNAYILAEDSSAGTVGNCQLLSSCRT